MVFKPTSHVRYSTFSCCREDINAIHIIPWDYSWHVAAAHEFIELMTIPHSTAVQLLCIF